MTDGNYRERAAGRHAAETFHDNAYINDAETIDLVARAVVSLRQATKDEALAAREADFKALQGYFEAVADLDGKVSLEDIDRILDGAWYGKL